MKHGQCARCVELAAEVAALHHAQGAPEAVAMWRDAADAKDVRINKLEAMLAARAQCAPSLIEVASVIHEARFGRDYPENLRNSFDTECSSGRAYCIRLARAVMDGFRLSHVDASAVTSTPGQAIEKTDGGAS